MAQEADITTAGGIRFAYKKESKKQSFPISTDNSGNLIAFGIVIRDYPDLKTENAQLKAENAALKEEVAAMQAMQANTTEEILKIREIPREQAKEEIHKFFKVHDGETIYPSDIMEALALDYDLIYDICEELEKDGSIKGL